MDLLSANAPLIYVGYQRDPKSTEMDGWLREGEYLDDDVFRVMIKQRFPIIRGNGVIDSNESTYYIYAGRCVSSSLLSENADLLREEVKDVLLNSLKLGVTSFVVADVSWHFSEDDEKVYMYPLHDGDFYVEDNEKLCEVVKTIVGLHGKLIQDSVGDKIKAFRKNL